MQIILQTLDGAEIARADVHADAHGYLFAAAPKTHQPLPPTEPAILGDDLILRAPTMQEVLDHILYCHQEGCEDAGQLLDDSGTPRASWRLAGVDVNFPDIVYGA